MMVVPPLAARMGAAAGMLTCLGAMALAADAVASGLMWPALGAAVGVATVWQSWRLMLDNPKQKDADENNGRIADVEAQAYVTSAVVKTFDRTPSPNGYAPNDLL